MCTCSGIITKDKAEWDYCPECKKDIDRKVEEIMTDIRKIVKDTVDRLSGIQSNKRGDNYDEN